MSLYTPEQLIATQKANVDAYFGLSQKAFEGVEKLVELNLQVARTALSEVAETTRAALSAKDAQELLALQASMLQPAAEKVAAYGRHVYDIAASTSGEFNKVAEASVADAQAKFMSMIDTAAKNAPAGSESATALMKSAVAAASNAYDGMQKAVKQASDVAEANFQAISASATKAASQATTKAKRATV